MEGPNLKWGDPVGTYEIEIVNGGALFYYRSRQPNGGVLQILIPLDNKALAEMQGLLNMLVFDATYRPEDLPHGKVAIN